MSVQTPSQAILAATAYHEAGHAVAASLKKIPFKLVTIEADALSAGYVKFLKPTRSFVGQHRRGVIALAGEASQRRFNPQSVRSYHAEQDREAVIAYAFNLAGSEKAVQALVKLWSIQATELIEFRWPSVQKVAAMLLQRRTISQADVWALVFSR